MVSRDLPWAQPGSNPSQRTSTDATTARDLRIPGTPVLLCGAAFSFPARHSKHLRERVEEVESGEADEHVDDSGDDLRGVRLEDRFEHLFDGVDLGDADEPPVYRADDEQCETHPVERGQVERRHTQQWATATIVIWRIYRPNRVRETARDSLEWRRVAAVRSRRFRRTDFPDVEQPRGTLWSAGPREQAVTTPQILIFASGLLVVEQ